MKLSGVRIQNYRCYGEEISIDFDDLTAIVGRNDAGKSAILDALEVFFNDAKIDQDDGNIGSDPNSLAITCEFTQMLGHEVVVDTLHKTTLEAEHLLNKDKRLEITKRYDASLRTPKLREIFLTAFHPGASGIADLLSLKNKELKQRATELGADVENANSSINADLRTAIRERCADLKLETRRLPIADLEQGLGRDLWTQIRNSLPLYFLFRADRPSTDQDQEAQDPLKEAIKLALADLSKELETIKRRVEEQVREVADDTLDKLRQLDSRLAAELIPRFDEPRWQGAFKVALEDGRGVSLNKRGSGVRRLVLLSFLQAQAERTIRDSGRSAIYAVEEPETSQHPDNQRLVYHAIADLSQANASQVILTTHNPALGGLLPEQSLRYVEARDDGQRTVHGPSDSTYEAVANALGVLSSHRVKIFLGVEGPNDIEFLKGISTVLHQDDSSIPDLEHLESSHELIFIPFGGSNLWAWTSRLNGLHCQEIHIVDRDNEPPKKSHYHKEIQEIRSRPRCQAFETSKREMENYLHPDAIEIALDVRVTVDDFIDVPEQVAKAYHSRSDSQTTWESLDEGKRKDKVRRAKKSLNTKAVAKMTASMLTERDPDGEIRGWFYAIRAAIRSHQE